LNRKRMTFVIPKSEIINTEDLLLT
jgi:hypothetical protein